MSNSEKYKNTFDAFASANPISLEADMIKNNKSESVYSSKWNKLIIPIKVAIILGMIVLISGTTVLSTKAYLSHLERIRSLRSEEIIDMYENVFQFDAKRMSRGLYAEEEVRYSELYEKYCSETAEPDGEVAIISSKEEYNGKGLAYSTEDGVLYLPKTTMTNEQILQMIEFNMLERYVDYEAYIKASNPEYYKNYLDSLSMTEVDEIYRYYYMGNTETGFFSRELSENERVRNRILKKCYKENGKIPDKQITIINNPSDNTGKDVCFCTYNCTYYLPTDELSDEQLLELIDYQIKAEYCFERIQDEVARGLRSEWPHIDYVERERTETIDTYETVDLNIINQPWLIAYEELLGQLFKKNEALVNTFISDTDKRRDELQNYYYNVRFIFLNDDEVPELLVNHGYTPFDYDDRCNTRDSLYTYKDGKVVLLKPGDDTIDDFYGYSKPFSYVERKGMVYCDYYNVYGFTTCDNATGIIDNVSDMMSRMDTWDFDTLTVKSTASNIELKHAVYNYMTEDYNDAAISYEYYVEVTGINNRIIDGKKVDKKTYEEYENALWGGNTFITLAVTDFDKIYVDYDLAEALAKCYMKVVR